MKMKLNVDFDKMQFLFKGKRFTGVNLIKTRFVIEPSRSDNPEKVKIDIALSIDVDFLEVGDTGKYVHNATAEIEKSMFNKRSLPELETMGIQIVDELIKRYQESRIVQALALPAPDRMKATDLRSTWLRVISDYYERNA